jgi:hypothetical protein
MGQTVWRDADVPYIKRLEQPILEQSLPMSSTILAILLENWSKIECAGIKVSSYLHTSLVNPAWPVSQSFPLDSFSLAHMPCP